LLSYIHVAVADDDLVIETLQKCNEIYLSFNFLSAGHAWHAWHAWQQRRKNVESVGCGCTAKRANEPNDKRTIKTARSERRKVNDARRQTTIGDCDDDVDNTDDNDKEIG